MPSNELPLGPAPSARGPKPNYVVEFLPYEQTRVSPKNPRCDCPISDESVAPLAAEIKAVGQAHDAIGERASDGIVDLLAGARRRIACKVLDQPLRVRIYDSLTPEQAVKIANREDRGALEVSLWDKSASWQRMLSEKVIVGETRLADAVGEDKSAISRGLALQKAPAAILHLVTDRRAISMTQWAQLAPLLENDEQRDRVLACAALLVGQTLGIAPLVRKLTAAAAGKEQIVPVEVLNRHKKVIAVITPDFRGSFTIRVKSMAEQHPTYRIDHAKLINAAFLDVLKSWFPQS